MGLFSSPPSPTPLAAPKLALPTPPPTPDTPPQLPVFTPPPTDPSIAAATAQANQQSIASLQGIAQMDSASILARYGQQMSMANANAGSPLLVR